MKISLSGISVYLLTFLTISLVSSEIILLPSHPVSRWYIKKLRSFVSTQWFRMFILKLGFLNLLTTEEKKTWRRSNSRAKKQKHINSGQKPNLKVKKYIYILVKKLVRTLNMVNVNYLIAFKYKEFLPFYRGLSENLKQMPENKA